MIDLHCIGAMALSKAIGAALKEAREAKGLTQEDFVGVSGRTYLSEIERGLKSPTLEKLDQLATRIGIHPLELLVSCYAKQASMSPQSLLDMLNDRLGKT
ncbi:DNA-binding protein [Pseudomonas syringae pv. tagetis]|uniref:DNA-binding protein n=2 Tax=Pseudomonas TaxID=286 RepID=A0A3M3Z1X3_9PSED|nr:transcriptional regulator, PbsX family [Pseudomonas syringae pv. maculicola]RMO87894.1 DNA-binding protein [Pseudomonas syringae pv. tagetis]